MVDVQGLLSLGITDDRLARLLEALKVVGARIAQVSKVRVLSGEGPAPHGATKVGDFYFVVDVRGRVETGDQRDQGRGGRDERRGGRGGPGGRGGGRGPGGPGGRGPGGPGGRGPGGPGGRGPGGPEGSRQGPG
jgi:hypothetical protein